MELLVTIGALGIIAAIAIPTFLTQRQNMFDNMAIGDAQQLRMALQARATRTNTPLTWQTGGMPSLIGEFSPTEGVQHRVFSNNLTQWCALAWHERGTLNSPENPAWVSFDTAGINEGAPLTADICGELAEFWDDIPTPGPSDPSDPDDPPIVDTDGDGIPDDVEVELGLDPEIDQRLVMEFTTTGNATPVTVANGVVTDGTPIARTRTITLPPMTNATVWVDFGDGTPLRRFSGTSNQSNPWQHTFDRDGTFTVTVHGNIPRFAESNRNDSFAMTAGQMVNLTRVTHWGSTGTTSVLRAFQNAISLTTVATPPSGITQMTRMLQNAHSFNQSVANWDVSSATAGFGGIFWNNIAFTGEGIETWDTSRADSTDRMFQGAVRFNRNLNTNGSAWNVSNIRLMNHMFAHTNAFNGTLTGWNTDSAERVDSMFNGARAFNRDLSDWDVSRVNRMDEMFRGATAFNADIARWDTSNVTRMDNMFREATAFTRDLSGWNVSKVVQRDNFALNGNPGFNATRHPQWVN